MPISDMLDKFRKSGYSSPKKSEDHASTPRTIQLSDDEMKSLQPYNVSPGEEIVLEVTGKVEEDGHFHVMSAKYATGPGDDSGESKPPMVRMDTQPSPS